MLNGWILPIGRVALGKVWVCSLCIIFILFDQTAPLTCASHHGAQGCHQDIPALLLDDLAEGHPVPGGGESDVEEDESGDGGEVEGEGVVVQDTADQGEGEDPGDCHRQEERQETGWGITALYCTALH